MDILETEVLLGKDKNQKEFVTEFGVDEKVEVTELQFKGSRGYVNDIIINRNGIWYKVILTDMINQPKNVYKPEAIKYLGCFLKSIEN